MTCELSSTYRELDNKKLQERKRHVLYLIENYLKSEGLLDTLHTFQSESRLTNQYVLCDNVDLETVLQEYEAYYYLRFNKHPKITKKSDVQEYAQRKSDRIEYKKNGRVKSAPSTKTSMYEELKVNNKSGETVNGLEKDYQNVNVSSIVVTPLQKTINSDILDGHVRCFDRQLTKDYPEEWKPFVEIISKDIFVENLNIGWEHIIGLDKAKKLLKEAIVFPIKYPELFSGFLSPWKGILLHGPPGTGKTLLAKAVATECKTTFFNVSASSLISKWRGESEKMVRVLFELARAHAPSTIFVDELDALVSTRTKDEHEASRRLKSEFLIQLDGLNQSEDRVFLLATSNMPWDLDTAILRRFEKRIHIDLPDQASRKALLKYFLPPVVVDNPRLCCELDYALLANTMEGYSGSDIKIVCKEAAMQSLRDTFDVLERMRSGPNNVSQLKHSIKLKTISTQHVLQALRQNKPCANYRTDHEMWQGNFGAS